MPKTLKVSAWLLACAWSRSAASRHLCVDAFIIELNICLGVREIQRHSLLRLGGTALVIWTPCVCNVLGF